MPRFASFCRTKRRKLADVLQLLHFGRLEFYPEPFFQFDHDEDVVHGIPTIDILGGRRQGRVRSCRPQALAGTQRSTRHRFRRRSSVSPRFRIGLSGRHQRWRGLGRMPAADVGWTDLEIRQTSSCPDSASRRRLRIHRGEPEATDSARAPSRSSRSGNTCRSAATPRAAAPPRQPGSTSPPPCRVRAPGSSSARYPA